MCIVRPIPAATAPLVGTLLFLALCVAAVPGRAGNVNYAFNSSDGGWTVQSTGTFPNPASLWEWTPDSPSSTEGGWHVRRGPEQQGTGTYLVSPCFLIDGNGQDSIYLEVFQRFKFGGGDTGDPLVALGQVQYSLDDGQSWLGIRTSDFQTNAGHIPPAYASPPAPFIQTTTEPPVAPPGGWAVNAWDGETKDFGVKDHEPSAFTLGFGSSGPYTFGVGSEIEFRFLMGTQVPLKDAPPELVWELNSVQIKGVTLCPEPGSLALATVGILAGVGWRSRRRPDARRA